MLPLKIENHMGKSEAKGQVSEMMTRISGPLSRDVTLRVRIRESIDLCPERKHIASVRIRENASL